MRTQQKQRSFAAGEISEEFWNHSEYRIAQTGLARCRNMVVRPGGGLTRRPPTEFIAKAYETSILVPMNARSGDTFHIEIGHLKARFYRNGAALLDGSAVYEIVHSFTADDLADLRWQRSGDVMFFTHPVRGIWEFNRRGNVDWVVSRFAFTANPFGNENGDEAKTIRASDATGTVTLTAAGFTFADTDIGTRFKLRDGDQRVLRTFVPDMAIGANEFVIYNEKVYENIGVSVAHASNIPPVHDGGVRLSSALWKFTRRDFGEVAITAVASGGATATATVITRIPEEFVAANDTAYGGVGFAKSHRWSRQAFSDADGWPEQMAIHQQRLYFFKGSYLWASAPGDYRDFTAKATPDGALFELIGSTAGQAEDIVWMSSGKVGLIGTGGQEFSISAQSTADGISPSNLKIVDATSDGSSTATPVRARGAVLHLSADGRALNEVIYNFQIDDFDSDDRALPSNHLTAAGLKKIVFQRNPLRILWGIDNAGQLVGFTYNPKQELMAWHAHTMADAVVEDISVTGPEADGSDMVLLRVRRMVCGKPRVSIERLMPFFRRGVDTSLLAHVFLDCLHKVEGKNMTHLKGLAHLANATVDVVTSKGYAGTFDVDTYGCIALGEAGGDGICEAWVGFPMRAWVRLLPSEPDVQDGSTMGRAKSARILVMRGLGGPGWLAGDIDTDHDFAEALFVSASPGLALLVQTPKAGAPLNGDWDSEGMVDVWTDLPFAGEISALDRVIEIGD